jgi:hypothetical protein
MRADPEAQKSAAQERLAARTLITDGAEPLARVPKAEWPDGERWCAGCQSFVPLFYTRGSRCRACAGSAAHEAHVERTYGLGPGEYDDLMALQGGKCYICQRRPKTKRLAVDHDHDTGRVRGLLCPDSERGCNMAVLGGLSTAADGALAAARRAVEYLEDPPYERLSRSRIAQERPLKPWRADAPDWMR